jgi:hypothetical protein
MNPQHPFAAHVHAEPFGLADTACNEFLSGNRFGKPEIVVDDVVAGDLGIAAQYQGLHAGPARIDGGGQACRPLADDEDIDSIHGFSFWGLRHR